MFWNPPPPNPICALDAEIKTLNASKLEAMADVQFITAKNILKSVVG